MKKITTCAFALTFGFFLSSSAFAATPVASYPFDGDYGDASPIERQEYYSDSGLIPGNGDSFNYSEGKLGECLHMDGSEALKLNVSMNSESYTVSFWIKPDRIANCTPCLMITPYGFEAETFINLSLAVDNLSPNIWTHMVEPYDERHSTGMPGLLQTDEWSHITMVTDANMSDRLLSEYGVSLDEYTSGTALYVNGFLVAVGKAPKQLCISSTGYWFGVNIWDDLYSGCVDELYFYDMALSESEIKELYLESGGDENAEKPSGSTRPFDPDFNYHPNGGSFTDEYVQIEQGTVGSSNNFLNLQNAAPVTTQGVETTTNSYADAAGILGFSFTLLSVGMLLQYIKRKKNSYS